MRQIKTFKLFENVSKIVYRGINTDFDSMYSGIQYYTENIRYAKVFGHKVYSFYLNCDEKYIMDLDKWNSKLSEDTKQDFGSLFTIHSIYLDKDSESYGYKGLRDYILFDIGNEAFFEFQKEFLNAKVIKGRDSGNESQIVYAVRDNNLITLLS